MNEYSVLPERRKWTAVQADGTHTVRTPSRSLFQPPVTRTSPQETSTRSGSVSGRPWANKSTIHDKNKQTNKCSNSDHWLYDSYSKFQTDFYKYTSERLNFPSEDPYFKINIAF